MNEQVLPKPSTMMLEVQEKRFFSPLPTMPWAPDARRSHESERDPSESLSERRQKVLFPSLPPSFGTTWGYWSVHHLPH